MPTRGVATAQAAAPHLQLLHRFQRADALDGWLQRAWADAVAAAGRPQEASRHYEARPQASRVGFTQDWDQGSRVGSYIHFLSLAPTNRPVCSRMALPGPREHQIARTLASTWAPSMYARQSCC